MKVKIWRLPMDRYRKLVERLNGQTYGSSKELGWDPLWETKKEWKARLREHYNPTKLPICIEYYTDFGIVRFVPKVGA